MDSVDVQWPELDEAIAIHVPRIDIGRPTESRPTPDALCVLSINRAHVLCVRLHKNFDELYTFRDAAYWQGLFVIGWGDAFYVIDPESCSVRRHDLNAYFGYIYADDALLIASAERVVRVNPDGSIAWTSEVLGLDGVTIRMVDSTFIEGCGEWDPPGGWKPFCLRLPDGSLDGGDKPDRKCGSRSGD